MREYLLPFLWLLSEMAPYLLLGFLLAGVLHAFVPKSFYVRYLSENDFRSVALAALFGVPLPLCSCGVIPTAMSMRREGASRGATVSFLIATPQTGVDSIVATASLLGLPFALMRPVAAFATALFGGALTNLFVRRGTPASAAAGSDGACAQPAAAAGAASGHPGFARKCLSALHYGFVEMMQDIGKWLVVGLVLAGLITVFVPDGFFTRFDDYPLADMLLVLALSVPMYLCATGSVPVAAALMLKGLSPGAALVLLMAGPATNLAAILVVGKVLGRRTLVLYLASILFGAVGFGLLIDYLLPASWFAFASARTAAEACHGASIPGWKIASGILFLLLLAAAFIGKYQRKKQRMMKTERAYRIKGMMCNHCKANVERSLALVEGVDAVRVDLARGVAYVEGDADPQRIIRTIGELGYEYLG